MDEFINPIMNWFDALVVDWAVSLIDPLGEAYAVLVNLLDSEGFFNLINKIFSAIGGN